MSNRRNTIKSSPAKGRPRLGVLIVFGAVAMVGLMLLAVGLQRPRRSEPSARKAVGRAEDTSKRADVAIESKAAADDATPDVALVDDDGETLWASPTSGQPLDLAYVSPGSQIIAVVRPQAMLQNGEGQKALDALGPTGQQAIDALQQLLGVPLDRIARLIAAWQVARDGKWQVTLIANGEALVVRDAVDKLTNASEQEHGGQTYRVVDDWAYYVPTDGNGKVLVVALRTAIGDIIDLAGDPPPLRRDIERLLASTDADRDMTIVVTPNSLFSEGRSMFEGDMTRLRQPLFWFLGDELSAAALSLDWGENFFVELIAIPTLDTPPEQAARILAERVAEIPYRLEAYVVGLQPQPYGRMIIARFPAMIRKLSSYARSGFDADHVVLNAYLPAVAGHNLLMGAELTLAEAARGFSTVAEATSPSAEGRGKAGRSVTEKLKGRTTLRFVRDTLDAALTQLSRDVGVDIVVRGPDLQADGITKNQSFGIDLADQPAEEILVEILRLANPDKTATGPSDVKQKLVYVVEKRADGTEQVLVTTRAAAAARGDTLPAAFRVENP